VSETLRSPVASETNDDVDIDIPAQNLVAIPAPTRGRVTDLEQR
jgi:hypothetical protein